MKYGYLGPKATFTEAALIDLLTARSELEDGERIAMHNVQDALAAVHSGDVDVAVVPMENSVEGGVPATLDALTRNGRLQIIAETLVPITFVACAAHGTTLDQVTAFGTHPHAEAQTRKFVAENLTDAIYIPTSSTAAGAELIASGNADFQVAFCPRLAAESNGLAILADGIGDNADAVTRFVMVKRPGALPQPTGADKTTIVAGLNTDRAGALLELLEQFSTRGVNLARIESRPTGGGLGLYQFSIDVMGHLNESRVADALAGVHRTARQVQFLGSYPAASGERYAIEPTNSDEAFADAALWLDRLRGAESDPV